MLAACLAGVVLLLADLYALAWVGLWFGLKFNSASRAIRQTLFAVLVAPWFLWLASLGSYTHQTPG